MKVPLHRSSKGISVGNIIVICGSLIWLLAVYKVFFLKKNISDFLAQSIHLHPPSALNAQQAHAILAPLSAGKARKIEYVDSSSDSAVKIASIPHPAQEIPLPDVSEWPIIYEKSIYEPHTGGNVTKPHVILPPKLKIQRNVHLSANLNEVLAPHKDEKTVSKNTKSGGREGHQLMWPPVLEDHTVPAEDGADTMPILNIPVPKFWFPPPGEDINTIGTRVNGKETIFLMIASYRDFQCRETLESAFRNADSPERIFVGAVDQVVEGDTGCLDLEVSCGADPSQFACQYKSQIAVFNMDAREATGPVTARHIGDRMYRGQYFIMQMDAHCKFVRHWDSQIISQFRETGNEMAVLSSYLTDVQGSIDSKGDSTRNTRPIMCNSDFEGNPPARYLRHGSQPEDVPEIANMPQLQPFWAAGFSFSRGHFVVRVPYDAYQPMVFQGEEIAIGIRGFTHGYDFYAPRYSVVFHEYASNSPRRKKVKMFWDNGNKHIGEMGKSLRRATSIIHMALDVDPTTWDHSELERYGLGKERPVDLFYKLFLIDPKAQKAVQLCPFVKSGIMHRQFQPHLRSNKMGIDYSALTNFDTLSHINLQFAKMRPACEASIRAAMKNKRLSDLQFYFTEARRIGLDHTNPKLVADAEKLLKTLSG